MALTDCARSRNAIQNQKNAIIAFSFAANKNKGNPSDFIYSMNSEVLS